jgi:hypothetical protein
MNTRKRIKHVYTLSILRLTYYLIQMLDWGSRVHEVEMFFTY